jgi:hypothetical protein
VGLAFEEEVALINGLNLKGFPITTFGHSGINSATVNRFQRLKYSHSAQTNIDGTGF